MSHFNGASTEENLLCEKGLAKRRGLLAFLNGNVELAAEGDVEHTRDDLLLRHDDGVIRETFNRRCGDIGLLNPGFRAEEETKRHALLSLIYRLYKATRDLTPKEIRRELRTSEVEALISAVQRLVLIGGPALRDLAAHCERCAVKENDLLACVMDPLMLRHILTFYRASTEREVGSAALDTLKDACRRGNAAAVRSWFHGLVLSCESLPKDISQLLRATLLELWRAGDADLGALAHEIAVLDVQLFEDLGWESTRAFCSQLRKITGLRCESLDIFLTDEDVDDALTISEELNQTDLVQHFRKLVGTYDVRKHRDFRRNIMGAAAKSIDVAAAAASIPTPERVGSAVSYSSYALAHAAN